MASETIERAFRYNMPGYQGNQVSMVYLYSDQEKTEEFMKSATESSLLKFESSVVSSFLHSELNLY